MEMFQTCDSAHCLKGRFWEVTIKLLFVLWYMIMLEMAFSRNRSLLLTGILKSVVLRV